MLEDAIVTLKLEDLNQLTSDRKELIKLKTSINRCIKTESYETGINVLIDIDKINRLIYDSYFDSNGDMPLNDGYAFIDCNFKFKQGDNIINQNNNIPEKNDNEKDLISIDKIKEKVNELAKNWTLKEFTPAHAIPYILMAELRKSIKENNINLPKLEDIIGFKAYETEITVKYEDVSQVIGLICRHCKANVLKKDLKKIGTGEFEGGGVTIFECPECKEEIDELSCDWWLKEYEKKPSSNKIICVDNYGTETKSDVLVCENVNDYYGKKILDLLNENPKRSEYDFFRLVEKDYKLYDASILY